MEHWQQDFLRSESEVVPIPAGHKIYQERLEEWRNYLEKYGSLPSILLTESGWMVNGHHRLIVAEEKGIRLHGLIVEHNGKGWTATGNLCLIKFKE